MPGIIDLRSDTVTRPTPGMRAAMFAAEVGDDVFCDDPTVNLLQEKAAALLGREAALFLASGTMANQVALKVLTQAGDEVLLAEGSHSYMFESGAASIIGSLHLHVLPADRGRLSPEQIEANISPDDVHFAPTTCVSLENTHNRGGGSVYPLETIVRIRQAAEGHSLVMHLDGARLFNACAASGVTAAEYARHFETVSFCLSKGLGAPVGSMLVGDRDTIKLARRWRKVMGGGMRQAGFLAAAG
ncbi:MAG: threonine aldolase family protein, partial [Pseudomonadota bacterium]